MKSYFLCLLIACFLVVGCKREPLITHTISGKDSASLVIALQPTLACLPVYYGEKTGIFDSLGLHFTLKQYASAMDCDTAAAKGVVSVAYSDLFHAVYNAYRGIPLQVVMAVEDEWQLVSNKGLRLKKIGQMKERMVGIDRHSTADFLSDTLCGLAKIEKEDLLRIQINNLSLRKKMMNEGQIDAAFLPQPYAKMAILAEENKVLFTSHTLKLKTGVFVAYKADKNQIGNFLKGYELAAKRIMKRDDVVRDILVKHYHVIPELVDSVMLPRDSVFTVPTTKEIAIAVKWLKQRNLLTNSLRIDSICSSIRYKK